MQVVKCGRAAASRLSSSSHEELGMLLRSQVNFQNVSIHLDLEYELEEIRYSGEVKLGAKMNHRAMTERQADRQTGRLTD